MGGVPTDKAYLAVLLALIQLTKGMYAVLYILQYVRCNKQQHIYIYMYIQRDIYIIYKSSAYIHSPRISIYREIIGTQTNKLLLYLYIYIYIFYITYIYTVVFVYTQNSQQTYFSHWLFHVGYSILATPYLDSNACQIFNKSFRSLPQKPSILGYC